MSRRQVREFAKSKGAEILIWPPLEADRRANETDPRRSRQPAAGAGPGPAVRPLAEHGMMKRPVIVVSPQLYGQFQTLLGWNDDVMALHGFLRSERIPELGRRSLQAIGESMRDPRPGPCPSEDADRSRR